MSLGANYLGDGKCRFEVWAPHVEAMALRLKGEGGRDVAMERRDGGIHTAVVQGVAPGTDYMLVLPDGSETPDPAAFFLPQGVTGPSRIVDHAAFPWQDRGWRTPPLADFIIYELHTGTFTPQGTFQGIIERIPYLKDLGITAVEIMPVAQFPGARNWGYDGVFPYAAQHSYGGPDGLKELVDACHRAGLAVILDVVYNHFGPEGCVQDRFGPVLTDRHKTAWGKAVNFDGPGCDGVRELILQNALYWFRHFHMDALRLDAVHALVDLGCRHILQEMSARTRELSAELGRPLHLIGESDLNDVKVVQPRERNGWGLDAMWSDDLHHSLHSVLTGEREGYYEDFGKTEFLAKALREPHVYDGRYSVHRGRIFGNSARGIAGQKFVVCSQNHDQVGNRKLGDRLSTLVAPQALRLAALTVLLSPYVPLLFMGEEYGETHPFLYFADHSDPCLLEAVREGRKAEFSRFGWKDLPPDPFSEDTFKQCRLDWGKLERNGHRDLFEFYKFLIRLRKEHPALAGRDPQAASVRMDARESVIVWERTGGGRRLTVLMNFSPETAVLEDEYPAGNGRVLAQFASDEPSDFGFNTEKPVAGGDAEDADYAQGGAEASSGETAQESSPGASGASGETVAVAESETQASVGTRTLEPWGFLLVDAIA